MSGLIVFLGRIHNLFPHTAEHFRSRAVIFKDLFGQCHLRKVLDQVKGRFAGGRSAFFKALMPFAAFVDLQDIGCAVLDV